MTSNQYEAEQITVDQRARNGWIVIGVVIRVCMNLNVYLFFTRTLDARNTSESPRQQTKHSQQIIKNDLTKMSKNMSETQNIHNFSFCECYFIHASVRLARVSIDFFDGIFCLATSSPSVFLFCCCCRVFEIRE